MDENDKDSESSSSNSFLVSLIAGASAGVGVDLALFPLDTVKTRLQSKHGFLKSGGFRGIYNGLPSTLLGSAPTAALFFTVYDSSKRYLRDERAMNQTVSQLAAANLGEVTACLIRVPVDVVKQRAQATHTSSALSAFKHVLAHDGFRGFYRSYLTTVMREIPFGSIQYPLWEHLKSLVSQMNSSGRCDPSQSALCGALAGAVAAGLTTPMDVAKTRITLAQKNNNFETGKIARTIINIYRENGLKGLFAGITPRVTMISVGGFIFFGIYEKARELTQSVLVSNRP